MTRSIIALLLLTLFAGAGACHKQDERPAELSARDMLLGTWKRILRATDYNGNGLIDSSEIVNAPATDTFRLTFSPDASYIRQQVFKGNSFYERGTWRLLQGDTEVVLQPATSTSAIDTFHFDALTQDFLRYRTAYPRPVRKWEAFIRPS